MFTKILIANRGEIACRVIRTARSMGIATVAVYSDADEGAPHMRLADEAIHIGPAPAAQSYLVGKKILEAAQRTGAQAIHPGYGFLSENADFCDACEKAGIVFIGPRAETIRAMGSKSAAKDLMEKAGVPTSPGYQGTDQSYETFARESNRIGYPVLLKAVSGGGGKGMRLVENEGELAEAIKGAQREGKNSFGDDRLLVEKYIRRARHLEVQICGDEHGQLVHLFERDCSVQRRHQKIIEEAPAPNLPAGVRARLLDAGVAAGKAVDYRGAGTVEFLYDGGDNVYFMEMNTRLQVEHPVSEAITGIDLVEWQLRVANGEPLPCNQDQITEFGHAFESRLYAENPDNNFSPSIGILTTVQLPNEDPVVRIDSGVAEGQAITPFYDPMIAKIITHGADRGQALSRMARAMEKVRVAGLETNARFLHALCREPDFASGDVSTAFIAEHRDALFGQSDFGDTPLAAWLLGQRLGVTSTDHAHGPWDSLTGWRMNRPKRETFWMDQDGEPALINMEDCGTHFKVTLEPFASADARREKRTGEPVRSFVFTGMISADGDVTITTNGTTDGQTHTGFVAPHLDGMRVWFGAQFYDFKSADPLQGAAGAASVAGSLNAPMPGTVTAHVKKPGDKAAAGETLLVMEAMKMEHAIKAPHAGIVDKFRFAPGQQVAEGDLLVELREE